MGRVEFSEKGWYADIRVYLCKERRFMRNIYLSAFVSVVFMAATPAFAQGPPPPPPLNEVPLDGFSALLLAAGAGYGAKRALDKKRKDGQ